ncbi:hypothetical protein ABVT39_012870 [Epinephelus coioides]
MLGTLCTLITALTCVSGVTVVTQKPSVVTLRKGETATMDCNLGNVNDAARWYKQIPGGVTHVFISFSLSSPHTPILLTSQLDSVSGVTVVTQKPPVVTLRKGETATMDCNLGTVTDHYAHWYKQIPGGVPQYILSFYHSYSSPTYGSGFSAPKFTSTHQSKSDYRLIINNVEEGDSAVYYCNTWDDSAKEYASQ